MEAVKVRTAGQCGGGGLVERACEKEERENVWVGGEAEAAWNPLAARTTAGGTVMRPCL
jgi:hypothetical protein